MADEEGMGTEPEGGIPVWAALALGLVILALFFVALFSTGGVCG